MMKYISSDTNVWFDFYVLDKIGLPFKLDYTYIIHHEVLDTEVISPPELVDLLIENGLEKTEMSDDEYFDVPKLKTKYVKLSLYDSIALSIAKHRKIPILTGDLALRKAANNEGVRVIGTIGILDELYFEDIIDSKEYMNCLKGLLSHKERRQPEEEINKRIKRLEEKGRD